MNRTRIPMAAAALGVAMSLVAVVSASGPSGWASAASAGDPAPLGLGAFPVLPTGDLPEESAKALQAALDEAVETMDVPGIAAAVILANQGTWSGAAGTADGTAPLDPAAQFAIGSVTKTVIAAQVLKLVEAGAVDLDHPIAEYVGDDLPTNGATVRQVLGMRSGIGDVRADPQTFCPDLSVRPDVGVAQSAAG
jgi:D-alanyl-D-alanine carboxypeptidase